MRRTRKSRIEELTSLARRHDGSFAFREAINLGVTASVLERLVERGRLEAIGAGRYRFSPPRPGRLALYRKAVMQARAAYRGDDRIVLSHHSALDLYGIAEFRVVEECAEAESAQIHLTVSDSFEPCCPLPSHLILHRAGLAAFELSGWQGIPVTTVERSILDVQAITHRTDLAHRAVADALVDGLLKRDRADKLTTRISVRATAIAQQSAVALTLGGRMA